LANSRLICEIMAQEIAHSYGLDHELLASDPMTYLPYVGNRRFRDETAACGEKAARPCGINGNTCRANQNSVALLRERLGVADPTLPTGELMSPVNGDLVPPSFDIAVTASDNIGIASVEIFVDDVSVGTKTSPPYTLTTSDIAVGERTVTAVITDQAHNEIRRSVSVTVEAAPSTGLLDSCSAGGAAGAGGLLPLALAALVLRRRRRVAT
jgi:MYXO-CTERM domain-containing protein